MVLRVWRAYVEHAERLGYEDLTINHFTCDALAALTVGNLDVAALIDLTLRTGEYGVKAMDVLDRANTGTYGHPEVTEVSIDVQNRPGILISGHDLKDLEQLLEQSEGQGVDIIHAWRDASSALLSSFQEIQALCGQLRKCVVATTCRVHGFQWSDSLHHKLHRTSASQCHLQGQGVHH